PGVEDEERTEGRRQGRGRCLSQESIDERLGSHLMARGLNNVYLVGTLVQKPDLRYTPGGLAILEMNLAGNDNVMGDDDQPRELAWYHRATLFGAQAEMMA